MDAFNDAIEQMLWPERRARDPVLGDKVPGLIDRTTTRSYLTIPAGFLPDELKPLQGTLARWLPRWFNAGGDLRIGPIPAGVPVNLLANIPLSAETDDLGEKARYVGRLTELLVKLIGDLKALPADATDAQALQVFRNLAEPMLALSKCPDFVVNRGHYFGTAQFAEEPALSDDDKRALIEFLKTF